MDGEVAVGIAAQDTLLIGDSASEAAMNELRRASASLHDPRSELGRAPVLLVWRDGPWRAVTGRDTV